MGTLHKSPNEKDKDVIDIFVDSKETYSNVQINSSYLSSKISTTNPFIDATIPITKLHLPSPKFTN